MISICMTFFRNVTPASNETCLYYRKYAVTVSTTRYFNILTALLTRDTGTSYLQ